MKLAVHNTIYNAATVSTATGFVGGAGSAWVHGASSSEIFRQGIRGAAWGAAAGAVLGGVSGGITAKRMGANIWTGSRTDEFVIGEATNGKSSTIQKEAQKLAESYNTGTDAITADTYLHDRMKLDSRYNANLTTKSGDYGLLSDGKYLNSNGDAVGGYVIKNPFSRTSVHISPYATWADDVTFEAIAGHERIHLHHHYIFGSSYKKMTSESVAYKYSYDTYIRAGYTHQAESVRNIAVKLGFWGLSYPYSYEIYPIPLELFRH